MSDDNTFRNVAGGSALLTTIFMIGNAVTIVAVAKNPADLFNDASALLSLGGAAARMFHISMVFDLLAYLSFAPVVVFCGVWLRERRPGLASLFAFSGLAYSLLGSMGAVVEDAVFPQMMARYPAAGAAEQATLQLLANSLNLAVAHGIWNPLEVLMISVWFLGFGLLLRPEKRGLGILALVVGVVGLLDPVGWMVGSEMVLEIGALGTILMPIWAAWFGIDVLRGGAWNGSRKALVDAG